MEHVRLPLPMSDAAGVGGALDPATILNLAVRPPEHPDQPPAARILWIDPDAASIEPSVQALRRHGYEVVLAGRVEEAAEALAEAPDLILMEVALDHDDGLAACSRLAATSAAPILVFSAKTDALDRVAGLEFGADDYLAKDAHHLELLARVRALLRRARRLARPAAPPAAAWTFHTDTGLLFGPRGVSLRLTRSSAALLEVLLQHPNQRLSRGDLRLKMHGHEGVTDRSVDTRVARLRRELNGCEGAGDLVKTLRGGGYLLQLDAARTIRVEA